MGGEGEKRWKGVEGGCLIRDRAHSVTTHHRLFIIIIIFRRACGVSHPPRYGNRFKAIPYSSRLKLWPRRARRTRVLAPNALHAPAMSTRASRPKPIVLCPVRARQATGDDSRPGIPTSIPPGLYESVHHCGTAGVPSGTGPIPPLAYFCIRTLLDYADQVHCLGSHRIRCQPEVLRALSPPTFGDLDATTRCLCKLDPRLWSIIVQVYSGLPKGLQNYFLPLGDRHLPLLQAIPSTPSFALVTVVNLSGHVSDETSHALKSLHALCALDISRTSVSHLGIRHFAPMTTAKPSDPRHGTRGLRILRLCDCPKITDQVIGATSAFPLLAVLGPYRFRSYC